MGQAVSAERSTTSQVTIPGQGILTGYGLRSSTTNTISSIRYGKVPYALPVGPQDRFKKALPIPEDYDYTGEYYELGLKCPQPAVPNPAFKYVKSPSDEHIQHLNIWVPSSDKHKPASGWPVIVYIHGGWLQYGSPSLPTFNTNEMFDDQEFHEKFIIVIPGYRVNMFGFMSCKELLEESNDSSNFGFWDQRMAIEWVFKYIKYFGGNEDFITVGGISAGAYSAFFQLTYELYHPDAIQVIKQIVFQSNTPYSQPKEIDECQEQFDEIVSKLGIDKNASGAEKLEALRKLDAGYIEDFIPTLELHTFRAVTDNVFVPEGIIDDLVSGKLAEKLTAKNIRFISGEVDNEPLKYSLLNTPNSLKELRTQIHNYYPAKVVQPLLDLYMPEPLDENDDGFQENLRILYGRIISDGQVYASSRGFLNQLVKHGFPVENIFRYRVGYRAKWLDQHLDIKYKVPHALDFTVWFYAMREGYTEEERVMVNKWLKPYIDFLAFKKDIEWDATEIHKLRYFNSDGSVQYIDDPIWEWSIKVADTVFEAQTS